LSLMSSSHFLTLLSRAFLPPSLLLNQPYHALGRMNSDGQYVPSHLGSTSLTGVVQHRYRCLSTTPIHRSFTEGQYI
ncbi:hypothetical protein FB451DRAFT_1284795, partial [Mycena latifolia]